jgi:DNA polymerase-4
MILHIDMDAFYASIEQRDNPSLKGLPVVVGGSTSGRGVVSAASYEARKFGIHSAMSGKRAKELCPSAVFVRGRLQHYAAVGHQVREIFLRYTPVIQPLSLDEAFLDVSGTLQLFGSAEKIGRQIKREIQDELDLTASVGIAPLKFVAKIASDIKKPDGFVSVDLADIQTFLDPLPLSRLWGVGAVTLQRLAKFGCSTIGDLRVYPRELLDQRMGKSGRHLWDLANGIDPRVVVPDRNAKQISHERTFHHDIEETDILVGVLSFLTEQVGRRLRRSNRKAKSVVVKYRLSDFATYSRNRTFKTYVDSTQQIFDAAREILAGLRKDYPRAVRLIGVGVQDITSDNQPQQLGLFDQAEDSRNQSLDRLTDQVVAKLGETAIYRAGSHRWVDRKNKSIFPNQADPPVD